MSFYATKRQYGIKVNKCNTFFSPAPIFCNNFATIYDYLTRSVSPLSFFRMRLKRLRRLLSAPLSFWASAKNLLQILHSTSFRSGWQGGCSVQDDGSAVHLWHKAQEADIKSTHERIVSAFCGPTRAWTWDPLIMSQVLLTNWAKGPNFHFFCPIAASGCESSVGHYRKVTLFLLSCPPCTRNKINSKLYV